MTTANLNVLTPAKAEVNSLLQIFILVAQHNRLLPFFNGFENKTIENRDKTLINSEKKRISISKF